jgi:hypothetical protein
MANTSINYLFPPDQIHNLPTWRFILHFIAPEHFHETDLKAVKGELKGVEWSIISFPQGIDSIGFDSETGAVDVPIEVPVERRRNSDSLADYESDFWKVCGYMMGAGFWELYYEAVDWVE